MSDDFAPRPFAAIADWERRLLLAAVPTVFVGIGIGWLLVHHWWPVVPGVAMFLAATVTRLVKSARARAWSDAAQGLLTLAMLGLLPFLSQERWYGVAGVAFVGVALVGAVLLAVQHRADAKRAKALFAHIETEIQRRRQAPQ
jgi:hypothetical protein